MTVRRKTVGCPALLAILCGVTLLSGCSLAPHYERPSAPIPVRYGTSGAKPDATAVALPPQCLRNADPRLERLIAAALEHNLDLKVAVARVEEARALNGIQSAARLPTVSLEGPGINPVSRKRAAYTAGLAISSYELDFFGKAKSLSDAVLHDYLATEQAQRTVRISLVAEVARAYVIERAAAARVAVAQRTVASRKAATDLMVRRFVAGSSSPLELQQARTLVASAEADLIGQTLIHDRAMNQLSLLTGYSEDEGVWRDLPSGPAFGSDAFDAGWGPVEPGLPSDLLVARPDIMAAEQHLMAANAQIGAARAAFFPSIRLTAMGGVASKELVSLFTAAGGAWQFVPQLSLPLFDGGQNQSSLDLAKARKTIAVVEYERTIQTAFREVSDALAGQAMLDREVSARKALREMEEERHTLTMKRYRAGAIGYLEVLDAERSLHTADEAVLDALRSRLENAITLYRALGGAPGMCRLAAG